MGGFSSGNTACLLGPDSDARLHPASRAAQTGVTEELLVVLCIACVNHLQGKLGGRSPLSLRQALHTATLCWTEPELPGPMAEVASALQGAHANEGALIWC